MNHKPCKPRRRFLRHTVPALLLAAAVAWLPACRSGHPDDPPQPPDPPPATTTTTTQPVTPPTTQPPNPGDPCAGLPRIEGGRLTPRICWATVWWLAESGEGTVEGACGLAKRAGFNGVLFGISPDTKPDRVRYVLATCQRKGLWAGIGLEPWDVVRSGNDWSTWTVANVVPAGQAGAWARGIVERYKGDANAGRIAFWSSGVLDCGDRAGLYGSKATARQVADDIARAAHDADPCRLTFHFPEASHLSTDDLPWRAWNTVCTSQSDHSWGADTSFVLGLYRRAPWGPVFPYEPLYWGLGKDEAVPGVRAIDLMENDGWIVLGADIRMAVFLPGWEDAFRDARTLAWVREFWARPNG